MGQVFLEYATIENLIAWAVWIVVAEYVGAETHIKPFEKDGSFDYCLLQVKIQEIVAHKENDSSVVRIDTKGSPIKRPSVSVGETVFIAPGCVQVEYIVSKRYHETGVARSYEVPFYENKVQEMKVGEKYIFFVKESAFAPEALELAAQNSYDDMSIYGDLKSKLHEPTVAEEPQAAIALAEANSTDAEHNSNRKEKCVLS
eukprot:TRINITY_DN15628_c0_g1_i1.p1 TRINITY_DN15628_c0_g1~~TRINITY_DN15628_c0_g1_i1.p1  ORF type:complete len:201 (-),score=26.10 TRINITY_DN15628_c0_g1_i1:325-927(-)